MPRLEFPTLPTDAVPKNWSATSWIAPAGGFMGCASRSATSASSSAGRTSSYYLKQLAQHCVWDVLPEVPLENGIVVE